jgi:hypothetical protein
VTKVKKLTLNETEKDLLIRALTGLLILDLSKGDRGTVEILLLALKKL